MDRLLQYKEAEEYILSIPKFTKKNEPAATKEFWEYLGCPGEKQKIIHIAGTNGKGSVCSYLTSLLTEQGYTVGMFTSPHLVSMTERIRLKGEPVSEDTFMEGFEAVMAKIKEKPGYHPTFFEILFFIAMVVFDQAKPDYIILETGMGGRLDATNCIEKPVMTIISRIGRDHTEYLGDTVEKIAWEKAGILKEGTPLICLKEPKEAYGAVRREAEKKNVPIFAIDDEDITNLKINKKAIDFSYKSRYYDYVGLTLSTSAVYQIENGALALKAFEYLPHDRDYTEEILRLGMKRAVWEGRMEEVLSGVYIDGAHNEDGIGAFLDTVRLDKCCGRRALLFSAVKDKNYKDMLKKLAGSGLFGKIAIAPLQSARTCSVAEMLAVLKAYKDTECESYDSIEDGFAALIKEKGEADRMYAAGSLYMVGQIKTLLRRNEND